MKTIEIWQPRYHDDVCLIAKKHVAPFNKVIFTKAKHLRGLEFIIPGQVIREYPLESNGRIPCYAVPMEVLEKYQEN